MPKIMIRPTIKPTGGEGGIKRVVEAQLKHLPALGWTFTDDADEADIIAVHATTWVQANKDANKPVVTHCHGLYWDEYPWPNWAHEANREVTECIRKADAVTAPTTWVAQAIRRGTGCPVVVVPNGVDLDLWQPREGEATKGYILWNKTRPDPICDPRVVGALANMMPNQRFVTTVGVGDEPSNVLVIGVQDHATHAKLVREAGLYLCTARETFGIGTIEAMAAGVPIVGWNWGGQREILKANAGYLAQPGDYKDLVRGIQHVLANREAMAQGAKAIAAKYQWSTIMTSYDALYRRVLDHQPTKRVSVIIPSYNLERWLPEAIDSVVQQLGDNDELIIVDDCSTDNSDQVAIKAMEQWNYRNADGTGRQKGHVSALHTPHNLYLAGALNYGIERANGRYVLNLDADNLLPPNTLNTLAGCLDNDRSTDIAYGKVKFIREDGSPDLGVSADGISGWPGAVFNYEQQMQHRNQIPSGAMYRKKVWERVGGYRRRCRTAEDADFWCRTTSFGGRAARVTDAVTMVYRQRDDSMSRVNSDWPWHLWYDWKVPPFSAPSTIGAIRVPTYEPVAVSVIIPVGPGHGGLVLDALDSLYAQSLPNWEAIVVDDCGEIPWLPSWVRRFSTPHPGSGTAAARNIGIARARGHAFVLLDADDYLAKNALERMYTVWAQDGSREHYVYTNFYKQESFDEVKIEPFDSSELIRILKHPVTCMYPIGVREQVQFDPEFRVGEDWDYVIGVVEAGYCGIHLQEPLMYYRIESGKNRVALLGDIEGVRDRIRSKWGTEMGRR